MCCRSLPLPQFAVEFFHFQRTGCDLVELLGMNAVGGFDGAIEFRRAGGNTNQKMATTNQSDYSSCHGMAYAVREITLHLGNWSPVLPRVKIGHPHGPGADNTVS